MGKNKYTAEQWNNIVEEYKTTSMNIIKVKYDIAGSTLTYQAKKRGFIKEQQHYRKHRLNENYFENIDNEYKAYWLGFIMADGCIGKSTNKYNSPNRLSFNISANDKFLLEKLKEHLQSTANISIVVPKGSYSQNPIARMSINSIKLCSHLILHGITESKTGHEILPQLSDNLMPHFIRGFFDGDGHISKRYDGKPTVGFTSNNNMLNDLKTYLHNTLNTSNSISLYHQRNVSQLIYGKTEDAIGIYNYLYSNANIYLERKYNKFTSLLSK